MATLNVIVHLVFLTDFILEVAAFEIIVKGLVGDNFRLFVFFCFFFHNPFI